MGSLFLFIDGFQSGDFSPSWPWGDGDGVCVCVGGLGEEGGRVRRGEGRLQLAHGSERP